MSLLNSHLEGNFHSEPFIKGFNLRKLRENSGSFVKIVSPLLLIFGLNEIRPQIALAEQLPILVAQVEYTCTNNCNYSRSCYNCYEKPVLTGSIKDKLKQLRTYMQNKEKIFSKRGYIQQPEVFKHNEEMMEFRAWEKRLLRQLKRPGN
jgi:hypothetical protein